MSYSVLCTCRAGIHCVQDLIHNCMYIVNCMQLIAQFLSNYDIQQFDKINCLKYHADPADATRLFLQLLNILNILNT